MALGFIVVSLTWMAVNYFSNYAERTAKPLESALLKAGAVKQCSTGDNGRGWDNNAPWYSIYYELPQNRESAIKTINKIAAENGYDLIHASKMDKGPLSVDDKYVDNWFYAGKPSPYKDLEGEMKLFFGVNNDGPFDIGCGTKKSTKVNSGPNVSAINIQIHMPARY